MAMRSERHIAPVTGTDIARFLNQRKASPSKQASALASKNTRSSTINSTSSITEETGEKKALKGGKKTSQPNAITIACNGSGSDYIAQEEEGVPDLSNPLPEQIKPVISTTVCTNTGPVGSDISESANAALEVPNVNKKSVSPTLAVTATRVETHDYTACHLPDKDLLKQDEAVSLEAIPSPKRCTETFLRGIETTAEPEAEVEPVETTARAHFSSDKEGRYVSRQRCNIRVVLLTGLSLVLSIWVLFWSADEGAMEQPPPT
ncbi:unnamed protein product [Sphagnum compactum]